MSFFSPFPSFAMDVLRITQPHALSAPPAWKLGDSVAVYIKGCDVLEASVGPNGDVLVPLSPPCQLVLAAPGAVEFKVRVNGTYLLLSGVPVVLDSILSPTT